MDNFWSSYGNTLRRNNMHISIPTISSADNFADMLHMSQQQRIFNGKKAVLFIDEFDELYKAPQDVLDSLLNVLRGIKQEQTKYNLQVHTTHTHFRKVLY